jgi:CRISPR-associated endonuclease/helicase Cas3
LAAVWRGLCVVWIRNTVREALAAHVALSAKGVAATLFHARFAQAHRLEIEAQVRATFGKTSTPADRAGQVLIATQVVEQSLDLDFDLMITDLAPIDLIIQRAGRLHRHDRGPRGTPLLVLHAPVWTDAPDSLWVSTWSPGTARIYPDHGRLWLTLKLLRSGFALPDDSRRLVEGVYGGAAAVPDGLSDRADRASRERAAMTHAARANVMSSNDAYAATDLFAWDDEDAPTRLGERSREWVLCEGGEPITGELEGSVVSLRLNAISKAPECRLVAAGSWRRTLDFHDGVARCERPDGSALVVRYDRRQGLSWSG